MYESTSRKTMSVNFLIIAITLSIIMFCIVNVALIFVSGL